MFDKYNEVILCESIPSKKLPEVVWIWYGGVDNGGDRRVCTFLAADAHVIVSCINDGYVIDVVNYQGSSYYHLFIRWVYNWMNVLQGRDTLG